MVTTRIPINRRQQQKVHITPEVLAAWRACKQIFSEMGGRAERAPQSVLAVKIWSSPV
jgi:hypothetical protein